MKPFYKLQVSFFLLLLFCIQTHAQNTQKDWQWIKKGGATSTLDVSGVGYRPEEVYDMGTDSQQNIYVLSPVGYSGIDIDGHPKPYYGDDFSKIDYALASFSCDGSYRWAKIIGGGGRENIPYLEVGPNDNIYVAGRFGTCDGYQPPNDMWPPRIANDTILQNTQSSCQALFLAKFNPDGDLVWLRQPQEPVDLTDALGHTLSSELASDGEGNLYWELYLPAGTYAGGAFTNTQEGDNYFIFKYDSAGNFIEAIPIDFQFNHQAGLYFKFYRNPYNGHFYFTDRLDPDQENATVGGQPVSHAFFLASFDENGNFLWKREDTTTELYDAPVVYNLQFDADNNIYLGGKFIGFSRDEFLGFSVEEYLLPSFVMKTDPTAENLLWASHATGTENASAPSVGTASERGALLLHGDELLFTGVGRGQGYTWAGDTLNINYNGFDVLFARFDTGSGDCLELTHIASDENDSESGRALAVDAAGDYLVGGGFGHNLIDAQGNEVYNSGGQTDFFVAKYATQACNEPVAGVDGHNKTRLKAYPNPVGARLSVNVKRPTGYKLYALNGKLIKSGRLTAAHNSLSTSDLEGGFYLLQLKGENGKVQVLKVVKK